MIWKISHVKINTLCTYHFNSTYVTLSTYINSTASLIKMQWTPHPSSQKLRAFFMRFCGNCKCTHIHMTRRLSERMAATKVCFLYLCLNVRKHNLGLNLLQISPSCLLMFIIISFNLGISCLLMFYHGIVKVENSGSGNKLKFYVY